MCNYQILFIYLSWFFANAGCSLHGNPIHGFKWVWSFSVLDWYGMDIPNDTQYWLFIDLLLLQ